MQNFVIETVIAVLLVFLLWSIDRSRSDLRVRFWLFGWSLVLVHFFSLLWHPAVGEGFSAVIRQAYLAGVEVLAAMCFILSDPAMVRDRPRLIRTGLLGIIPAFLTGYMVLFRPADPWVPYFSVVIAHAVAIVLTKQYSGARRGKFVLLASLYFLSACWMLGCLGAHEPVLVLASIPAELFLINAFLFSRSYSRRNPGNFIAVTGFALWAWSSFFSITLRHNGTSDTMFPVILSLPQFLVAIGMMMIILEQDATASRELVREYELLFNNNPLPLLIYDVKSLRFLSANPASARVHGYTVEEICKKKLTDIVDSKLTLSDVGAGPMRTYRYSMHKKKDGTLIPMNVTTYDVHFRGRAARIALAEDISERERMAAQLMYQVNHDLLTGLPNRATFLRSLDEIFSAAKAEGHGCAVLVLHVNRFERINEKYGHKTGDGLLTEATRLLKSKLVPQDAIGRTGSREYMIALAPVYDGDLAEVRARDILRVFDEPITIGEHKIAVSVSMGMAVFPEDSDDTIALLRDATRAQGRARTPGSHNLVRLSRKLSMEAEEESRIEGLIQEALSHSGFEVFYQPILNSNGEISGLEALLRLHDAEGQLIGPATFIPIAESTEAIIPVGRWVIRQVCRQLRQWQDDGLSVVPVAINVSALQIGQTNFCADVMAILNEFNITPSLVHLELTESSVMPQDSLALDNMLKLAAEGVRFSIDDFGTGFSSLGRLHQLPVSTLKIDRSFVTRMLEPNGTLPIVTTIISMAHSLNLGVVAEGVETREQFHALYEMGCDHFQGYFFGKPMNAVAACAQFSGGHRVFLPAEIAVGAANVVSTRHHNSPLGTYLW